MLPDDEHHRLSELRLYRILDTATEKAFDDLTQLASTICDTPISLVSLVDEHRQWFKSRRGLPVSETPRNQAFCAHTILQDEIMVVEDTTTDARFVDNQLVTGEPMIRFYAGAPLTMESGHRIGTLCVIDREPRKLTEVQLNALGVLRDAVVAQIELRRAANDLRAVANMIPMCAWCRKVCVEDKSESHHWRPLHEYVAELSPVSHGICPDCQEEISTS